MALLFMDGFDAGDAAQKWQATANAYTTSSVTRYNSGLSIVGASMSLNKSFPAATQVFVGVAFRATNLSVGTSLFSFYSDTGTTEHVRITITGTGALTINRTSTVLATSANTLNINQWNYIEASATLADAGGTVTVRVDGAVWVTYTGDTRLSGTATTFNYLVIRGSGSYNSYFDDFYLCDSTGTTNNTFLGDVRIQTLAPSGPGSVSNLTPVGSVNNWQNVDEIPWSANDYNISTSAGAQDLYAMNDLAAGTSTVFGVQSNSVASKTDAGARSFKPLLRMGGTTYAGSTITLTPSDTTHPSVYNQNPATGSSWTPSEVNSLESGLEIV